MKRIIKNILKIIGSMLAIICFVFAVTVTVTLIKEIQRQKETQISSEDLSPDYLAPSTGGPEGYGVINEDGTTTYYDIAKEFEILDQYGYGSDEYWAWYVETDQGKKEGKTPSYIEGYTVLDLKILGLNTEEGSDSDTDGISDKDELLIYHTNPAKISTSEDLLSDGYKLEHNLDLTKKYSDEEYPDDFIIEFKNNSPEDIFLYPKTPFDLDTAAAKIDEDPYAQTTNIDAIQIFYFTCFSGDIYLKIDLQPDKNYAAVKSVLDYDYYYAYYYESAEKISVSVPDSYPVLKDGKIKWMKNKDNTIIKIDTPIDAFMPYCIYVTRKNSPLTKVQEFFQAALSKISLKDSISNIESNNHLSAYYEIPSMLKNHSIKVYYTQTDNEIYNDIIKKKAIDKIESIIGGQNLSNKPEYTTIYQTEKIELNRIARSDLSALDNAEIKTDTENEYEYIEHSSDWPKIIFIPTSRTEILAKYKKHTIPQRFLDIFNFNIGSRSISIFAKDTTDAPATYLTFYSQLYVEEKDNKPVSSYYVPDEYREINEEYSQYKHTNLGLQYGLIDDELTNEYIEFWMQGYSKETKKADKTGFCDEDILPFANFTTKYGATGLCAGISHLITNVFNNNGLTKNDLKGTFVIGCEEYIMDFVEKKIDENKEYDTKGQMYAYVPQTPYYTKVTPFKEYCNQTFTYDLTPYINDDLKTLLNKGLNDYKDINYTKYIEKNYSHFYDDLMNNHYVFGKKLSDSEEEFVKALFAMWVKENSYTQTTEKHGYNQEYLKKIDNPEVCLYTESTLNALLHNLDNKEILSLAFRSTADRQVFTGHELNIVDYRVYNIFKPIKDFEKIETLGVEYEFDLYDNNYPYYDGPNSNNGKLIITPIILNGKTYIFYHIDLPKYYSYYALNPRCYYNYLVIMDGNYHQINK